MKRTISAGAALALLLACPSLATAAEPAANPPDLAQRFGALEDSVHPALSADGQQITFLRRHPAGGNLAMVSNLQTGKLGIAAHANGQPMDLSYCDWSAADRLVCMMSGVILYDAVLAPVSRMVAVNTDGTQVLQLGQENRDQLYLRQFDGEIVDWRNGVDGKILMARRHVPEFSTGRRTARTAEGLAVELIDTRTGKADPVEAAHDGVEAFVSDGLGTVRMRTTAEKSSGDLTGVLRHDYRKAGSREWLPLGTSGRDQPPLIPLAVDPTIDAAYVLRPLDGRLALYRIALDGSMKEELAFASKEVDVEDVVRVGRGGRVIGASYVTDRRHVEYFEKTYQTLARSLARVLPKLPLIYFVSASADERMLLVRASSDVEPGRYYLYDRDKRSLSEEMRSRPPLEGLTLSEMKAITYPAADGTAIPAYLTLPPGVTDPRNLPAIVMPHGGPSSRDEWGFDWLVQFYAQRGYVVLQPNFRGSAGYGEAWVEKNGYQNWQQSVGDVRDAGRWLVAQGIADPQKLAAMGWSYGGYAVLQANVLDADLFKAIVAVAPVTDLAQRKEEATAYTNSRLVAAYVGSGPHVQQGSPAQQAKSFKAPVLMFHGENDYTVSVQQSRRMDRALRNAGKRSELVTYPGLEHSLRDGTARADMLRRTDAFLQAHLKP